jgi:F-type H+-transporting ATPase subunit b
VIELLESLNGYQFIIEALNLIILYVVLRKILFKPVTEFMENRSRSIQNSIEDAQRQKEEASELKSQYERQIRGARADGEKIVSEAMERAERVSEGMIDEAKKEAQLLISNANKQIEKDREQMLRNVRSEVVGLAIMAASKVIEANMDTEDNRVLVAKFLEEVSVA